MRHFVTTVGWTALAGERTLMNELMRELLARVGRYSLRELAALVGRAALALEVGGRGGPGTWTVPAAQDLALHALLGPDAPAALRRQLSKVQGDSYNPERTAFVQERQLLNLFKLGLLILPTDKPDGGEGTIPFVEALLMLHDVMEPNFDVPDAPGGGAPEGESERGHTAHMELYMFANATFNQGEHQLHDQVRAHALYVAPASDCDSSDDLPSRLARAAGLPAAVAWNAPFALYTAWGIRTEAEVLAGDVAADRRTFLATMTGLTPADRERWLGLATADVVELQRRAQARYTPAAPRYFDLLVFEQTPLVAFGDTVYCLSVRLLKQLGSTGLQHRLLDPTVFTEAERKAALDARGRAVDRYATALLARTFGPRCVFEPELQAAADAEAAGRPGAGRPAADPERPRRKGAGRRPKVCEAVVAYADAAILFEVKAAHPPLAARQADDYAAYRNTWRRHLLPAADQLESTAALLDRGALRRLGLDPDAVRRVYPVVVTFEYAMTPLTYRAVHAEDLAGHPLEARAAAGRAAPLQVFDLADLEALEVAVEHGADALALLRAKTADPALAELGFDEYLRLVGAPGVGHHSRWHQAQYRRIADERRAVFCALGLPPSPAGGDPGEDARGEWGAGLR